MANQCPICNFRGFFRNYRGRSNAQCPECGSLERHRLVWLFWHAKTNLFDGQPRRMLHMAPEACFRSRLSKVAGLDYLTGDLNPKSSRAMQRLDLRKLELPSQHFDVWHCSHVLEHVSDDRAAMRELCRVLKPGGWGTVQVPLRRNDHTFCDPQARTPQQRKRAHGQHNHVRVYGELDLLPALTEAGLTVIGVPHGGQLPEELTQRHGVSRDELLVFCYKPPLPFDVL